MRRYDDRRTLTTDDAECRDDEQRGLKWMRKDDADGESSADCDDDDDDERGCREYEKEGSLWEYDQCRDRCVEKMVCQRTQTQGQHHRS